MYYLWLKPHGQDVKCRAYALSRQDSSFMVEKQAAAIFLAVATDRI